MKYLANIILILLIPCTCVLVTGEIALRLTEKKSYILNPPNEKTRVSITGRSFTVKTNSAGMRSDREFSEEKDKRHRIASIGDSYAFCFGVENEDCFNTVLERILNEKNGYDNEVLNMGKVGVGPKEYLEIVKNVAKKYNPDTVLISLYLGNDLVNVLDPYVHSDIKTILRKFRVLRYLLNLVMGFIYSGDVNTPLLFNAKRSPSYFKDMIYLQDNVRQSYKETVRVLKQIYSEAKTYSRKVVFVFFPSPLQVSEKYHAFYNKIGYQVDPQFAVTSTLQNQLATFFRENKIEYIDLLPYFKNEEGEIYNMKDDHLNRTGNALVARILYGYLIKN